jgi:proteasome lid subunit RPN8/RPN11
VIAVQPNELLIPDAVVAEMLQMVSGDDGVERCGFLLGRKAADGVHVSRLLPVRNAVTARGAFAVADAEVNRAQRAALARDETIVALVHSHPSGALALSDDDDNGRRLSGLPWVIVVAHGADAIGFRIFTR